MADKRRAERFDGWPGGLFMGTNPDNAEKVHLLQATNVVIEDGGAVAPRPGLAIVDTANYVTEVTAVYNPPVANRVHITTGKDIVSSVPAVIHTYVNGGRGQFAYFGGKMSHSNGLDAMQAWSLGAAVTADALGAPLSRILHIHNNRVFCANGQTLYETAPGTGPSDAVDNFAGGATWSINPSDGDPIVALASIGRDLYIFKGKSIWIQTGFTVNERQTRVFDSNVGCASPDSPRTVNIRGVGECIVFLSSSNKLCMIAGGSVQDVGDAIQSVLDSISKGSDTTSTVPSGVSLHRCSSCYHKSDGYYILGFATAAGNSPSDFSSCVVMHLDRPYQSKNGMRWPFTKWTDTNVAGSLDVRFGALGHDEYNRVGLMAITQSVNVCRVFFITPRLSKRSVDLSVDDVLSPILYVYDCTVQTYHESASDESIYKNWIEATARISKTALTDMTLRMTQTNDMDSITFSSDPRTLTNSSSNKIYRMTWDLSNDAVKCSITLSMTTESELGQGYGIKIHGLELYHTRGANT